jgi:hypothetical protein
VNSPKARTVIAASIGTVLSTILTIGCAKRGVVERQPAETHLRDAHGYELAREERPPGEAEDVRRILDIIEKGYGRYAGGNYTAHRMIHGKQHGCVRARFVIHDDIPFDIKYGVLAQPGGTSFPAWIRFSNGNGNIRTDGAPDGRGMAIKLMGLQGPMLSSDEAHTQDFLLQSSPNFFARNAHDYIKFMKLGTRQNLAGAGHFVASLNPASSTDLKEVGILAESGKIISSPLLSRYWGALPAQLGPFAVKTSVVPCPESAVKPTLVERLEHDYLRKMMREHLSENPACFIFRVQVQIDAREEPIEDATVAWDERKYPPVPVATIRIPKQEFDTKERMDFCENLSFNPWHSLSEHRPLGGLNRLRKAVYEKSSKIRHELNLRQPTEPREDSQQ